MLLIKHFVIQSGTKCSEESREHPLYATEILPPDGRLNDNIRQEKTIKTITI